MAAKDMRSPVLRAAQRGLTLVEVLVSLVVLFLIVLSTLALYNSSAAAYRSTDANQLLQDNARFMVEVLSQAVRQAGLQDTVQYAWFSAQNQKVLAPTPVWDLAVVGAQPALFGANNARITSTTNPNDFGTNGNGGHNASDVFGVRYFGASKLSSIEVADDSVVDCIGTGVPYPRAGADVGLSLFSVAVGSAGEPELVCINRERKQRSPLVIGVETLQVAYGIDTDPADDSTPNTWLNAAEVQAAGLWPLVRAVRFGFVLRGPPGSGVRLAAPQTLYPMGEAFSRVDGAPPKEAGLSFQAPADGRLRRAFSFTIALRNAVEQ